MDRRLLGPVASRASAVGGMPLLNGADHRTSLDEIALLDTGIQAFLRSAISATVHTEKEITLDAPQISRLTSPFKISNGEALRRVRRF